jgi:hypothetical protein
MGTVFKQKEIKAQFEAADEDDSGSLAREEIDILLRNLKGMAGR